MKTKKQFEWKDVAHALNMSHPNFNQRVMRFGLEAVLMSNVKTKKG